MTHNKRLQQLQEKLSRRQAALLEHPIYGEIDSIHHLHIFMKHHVFAVWDFMSLLKSLQQTFCNSCVPWLPPEDPIAARLINEIVLGEESDEDGEDGIASHFGLYHRAMKRCGASTATIDGFIEKLRDGRPIETALAECDAPECVRAFVNHTFAVIKGGHPCAIAAAFTFGREELLPDVFQRIVDELNVEISGGLNDFKFYLNRHIELDGDHHGPMAARMITRLCNDDDDKWRIAEHAASKSLEAREALWDGIYKAIQATPRVSFTS